ncbi:MAG: hypothetical protein ACPHSE_02965 [Flavobacteriaceae bacterium]
MSKTALVLIVLSQFVFSQKHKDPFTRSKRLPDISLGAGLIYNMEPKFKVDGFSLMLNADFYNFEKSFTLGFEYASNLKRIEQNLSTEMINTGVISGLMYNQSIIALRGGWIFQDNIIFILGLGMESLQQYRRYIPGINSESSAPFFGETGKTAKLFYYKLGALYRFNALTYEVFYSRRGVGLGINYFFGY